VYEHHTGCLDAPALADHLARFKNGGLSDAEIFDSHGHGCARMPEAPDARDWPVAVTGPRRAMIAELGKNLGWRVAIPFGDVMLAGCFGLVAATLELMKGT
jgi:uncharacterized protein (DUF1786 family)